MGNDAFSRGIKRHQAGQRPDGWNMDRSIQSLANCLGHNDRTEDDMFSPDISQSTVSGGMADLAAGIKAHHAADVAKLEGRDSPPKPYGNVKYADPANGKYPIDTAAHAKAAWAYISKPHNAAMYSPAELAKVKAAIKAACAHFGIQVSDNSEGGN